MLILWNLVEIKLRSQLSDSLLLWANFILVTYFFFFFTVVTDFKTAKVFPCISQHAPTPMGIRRTENRQRSCSRRSQRRACLLTSRSEWTHCSIQMLAYKNLHQKYDPQVLPRQREIQSKMSEENDSWPGQRDYHGDDKECSYAWHRSFRGDFWITSSRCHKQTADCSG